MLQKETFLRSASCCWTFSVSQTWRKHCQFQINSASCATAKKTWRGRKEHQRRSPANLDSSGSCLHLYHRIKLTSLPLHFEGYVKQRSEQSSKSSCRRFASVCTQRQRGINSHITSVGRRGRSTNVQWLKYPSGAKIIAYKPSQKGKDFCIQAPTIQTALKELEKEQCCRLWIRARQ